MRFAAHLYHTKCFYDNRTLNSDANETEARIDRNYNELLRCFLCCEFDNNNMIDFWWKENNIETKTSSFLSTANWIQMNILMHEKLCHFACMHVQHCNSQSNICNLNLVLFSPLSECDTVWTLSSVESFIFSTSCVFKSEKKERVGECLIKQNLCTAPNWNHERFYLDTDVSCKFISLNVSLHCLNKCCMLETCCTFFICTLLAGICKHIYWSYKLKCLLKNV